MRISRRLMFSRLQSPRQTLVWRRHTFLYCPFLDINRLLPNRPLPPTYWLCLPDRSFRAGCRRQTENRPRFLATNPYHFLPWLFLYFHLYKGFFKILSTNKKSSARPKTAPLPPCASYRRRECAGWSLRATIKRNWISLLPHRKNDILKPARHWLPAWHSAVLHSFALGRPGLNLYWRRRPKCCPKTNWWSLCSSHIFRLKRHKPRSENLQFRPWWPTGVLQAPLRAALREKNPCTPSQRKTESPKPLYNVLRFS